MVNDSSNDIRLTCSSLSQVNITWLFVASHLPQDPLLALLNDWTIFSMHKGTFNVSVYATNVENFIKKT